MVQYFTEPFFLEIADRLNADDEWTRKAAALNVKIVLTCVDRSQSFLLEVQQGKVHAAGVAPDIPADFKFEGPYEAWVQLGKGERDFQSLVISGKIKFRGSLPRIMGMMGPLTRITQTAQQLPKEF
jgi:putative sterol carrier protein